MIFSTFEIKIKNKICIQNKNIQNKNIANHRSFKKFLRHFVSLIGDHNFFWKSVLLFKISTVTTNFANVMRDSSMPQIQAIRKSLGFFE